MSSYELALKARISSGVEVKDLVERARTETRRTDRPRALTFRNIHVADRVFQWRIREDNLAADIAHIRELARTIMDKRKPLDPLLVTAIGQRFYVVDGHHRLEAYRLAKWRSAAHTPFSPESGHWALRTPRGNDTATSEALAAFLKWRVALLIGNRTAGRDPCKSTGRTRSRNFVVEDCSKKGRTVVTHPILGDELRALRRGSSASSSLRRPSYSPRSAERPSALPGLPAWSSGQGSRPS